MGSMFLFQLSSNAGLYDLSLWHVLVWGRILARKQFFAFCLIALVSTMSSPLEFGSMVYLDLYVCSSGFELSSLSTSLFFSIRLQVVSTGGSWFVSVLIICTFLFIPYILESRGGLWWQNELQAYKLTAFMVDEKWGDGNQHVRVGLWSDPPWLILAVVSIFTNDASLYSRRCLLSVLGLCEIFASASLCFCLSIVFGTSISLWWSLFCFWSSPKSSCFSLAA